MIFKETRVHKTVLSLSCRKFYPHAKQYYADNFTVLVILVMSVNLAIFDFLKLKIHIGYKSSKLPVSL